MSRITEREGSGELEETLGANEIGLEAGAKGIAAPSDTRDARPGFGEKGIVDRDTEGGGGRQFGEDRAADNRKDLSDGKAVSGEEPIGGGPVLKLAAAGSK